MGLPEQMRRGGRESADSNKRTSGKEGKEISAPL